MYVFLVQAKDDRVLLSRKWDDFNNTNFQFKCDKTSTKEKDKYRVGSPFNASSNSPSSVTSTTLDLNKEFTTTTVCQSSGSELSNQVDTDEQFEDFKTLYATLVERIGWQEEEVVKKISQALVVGIRGKNRGDKWFNILGHDKLGKMKLALTLAEVIQGSRESLIHVDLGLQEEEEIKYSSSIFDDDDDQVWNIDDVRCRGKNVVDYIAEKLRNKPSSVLLLQSIENADLLLQNSLLQAVKTAKFADSHGREISISNAIFVTTTTTTKSAQVVEPADYSEEDILAAKPWPIRMMIGFDLCDNFISCSENSCGIILNKRKRAHKASDDVERESLLDLNFPSEESEICDTSNSPPPQPQPHGNSETDSICDNSRTWLEDFTRQMDATVTFRPFDFDAIARKLVEAINRTWFEKVVVPPECSVEIDSRVMLQMIAAAYLTNTQKVEEWINTILGKGFEEAQKKYSLTARSTIKLVVGCEEGGTPTEILPSRIILN